MYYHNQLNGIYEKSTKILYIFSFEKCIKILQNITITYFYLEVLVNEEHTTKI